MTEDEALADGAAETEAEEEAFSMDTISLMFIGVGAVVACLGLVIGVGYLRQMGRVKVEKVKDGVLTAPPMP
jgi:hypothetical protein